MKVKSLIKKVYNSPLGMIDIISSDNELLEMQYSSKDSIDENSNATEEFVTQLDEYFAGKRKIFNLNLNMQQGTKFEQSVWKEISKIPYGETITYGTIAKNIGNPKAARAVGSACNSNPFLIVIPCHRVVGASGSLTGYAGGLLKKQWLLNHEKAI